MILLIPYEVRTLYQRNPWANLALILACVVMFLALFFDWASEEVIDNMVLSEWSPVQLLGYQFLHGGWIHLIGNMVFLFVFGNAVCGVMNGWLYLGVYLLCGALAGAAHLAIDGGPAVGASGSLCGIMGVYLAIYPQNRIHCFWFFLIRFGTFDLPGWLLILTWFALDLLGAFRGGSQVAHWAHVGGTLAGFVIGLMLLKLRMVDLFDYDNPTVLDWFENRDE